VPGKHEPSTGALLVAKRMGVSDRLAKPVEDGRITPQTLTSQPYAAVVVRRFGRGMLHAGREIAERSSSISAQQKQEQEQMRNHQTRE